MMKNTVELLSVMGSGISGISGQAIISSAEKVKDQNPVLSSREHIHQQNNAKLKASSAGRGSSTAAHAHVKFDYSCMIKELYLQAIWDRLYKITDCMLHV